MIKLIKFHKNQFTSLADYKRRGNHRPQFKIQKGQQILKFQSISSSYYKDFDITHFHFLNKDNLLNYHHFDSCEQLNTTSLIIPTPIRNTKAVNYAVQKMLQCGSKDFAVRNLISEMTNRSLNGITGAVTTEHYLSFTFQTHSRKDHNQLLKVYYSMIMDPLLREEDFNEVIYRLSLQNNKINGALSIVGDLANEMYVSNQYLETRLHKLVSNKLLGMDNLSICLPQQLIDLKFSAVVKFHKQFFTLPNLIVVSHGDFNPAITIQQLDKIINSKKINSHLVSFNKQPQNVIALPKTFPIQHLEKQVPLILAYSTKQAQGQQKILLSILSYILYDMPESPFMIWNTIETPYPKLYGNQDQYFVIGINFNHNPTEEQVQKTERQLFNQLNKLVHNKISDQLIEKALMHLQQSYYTKDGVSIIQSCVPYIIGNKPLNHVFEVTPLITRLLHKYRSENIFEGLIEKYFLNSSEFIRIIGHHSPYFIEDQLYQSKTAYSKLKEKMDQTELQNLINYKVPTVLQDHSKLPNFNVNEVQFFDDPPLLESSVKGIKVNWVEKPNGTKITIKLDVTDIGQQNFNMVKIFCEAYPRMGLLGIKNQSFEQIVGKYIKCIELNFKTVKDSASSLKIYLFLEIAFADRNFQHGFSILHGLINDWNYQNLETLSKILQRAASKCYNDVSDDIINYHALHLAGFKSPYAQIEDPLFHSRSLCSLASQALKVSNPKHFLQWVSKRMKMISDKMKQKNRWQVLVQCKTNKKELYTKYVQLMISNLSSGNEQIISSISTLNYEQSNIMKYFPNFQQEIVFQTFSVPYLEPQSPAALILSNIISNNIKLFNEVGGCFIRKGALVSFMGGPRKKIIQLQNYYSKIQDIDNAKRRILKYIAKHPYQKVFRTSITNQKALHFKQALVATTKQEIDEVLQNCILSKLKEGKSSVLALGPNLNNYDSLLKKGWQVERSIDQTSLKMESLSKRQIEFIEKKYIDL